MHEVKIDKSFVTHLVRDEDDATTVRSIIDMAGHLQLDVVAEGVEDRATWERLLELGCAYAQGWHLSRPVPLEELLGWLGTYEAARGRPSRSPGPRRPWSRAEGPQRTSKRTTPPLTR